MSIFFTRGRKAPYQQHVGFSLNNYLTSSTRAELQLRVEEYDEDSGTDLSSTIATQLQNLLDSTTVTVWGAKEKHADHFREMQPGDLSIFIDTSKSAVDHCMKVSLLLGDDVPQKLRQDISAHIWRDDSFKYIWFSETPIERYTYSTEKLQDLIQRADSDFKFPDSWFSMGDDFERLSPQTLLDLGGQEAFRDELRSEGVTIPATRPTSTLLVDQESLINQDHWIIAAKFTDTTGIDAETTEFDVYKDGHDSRIKYINVPQKSSDSDLLRDFENDAIVLVHRNKTIVQQGRLATVEGKRIDGSTHDIATVYDLRSTPRISLENISREQLSLRDRTDTPSTRFKQPVTQFSDSEYAEYLTKAYGKDIATNVDAVATAEPLQSQVYHEAAAHLIAGRNVVFYGPPGTGKTRAARQLTDALDIGLDMATANAEWSNYDVVGGYEPAGPDQPDIEWTSRDGILTRAGRMCTETLMDSGVPHWLLIDELNRANLDQAFGDVFTLLDIDYRTEQPLSVGSDEVHLPLAFRLLATMNTADRAKLFSLGYAFRRRFAFVHVPPLFSNGERLIKAPADNVEHRQIPNRKEIREIIINAVLDNLTRQRLLPTAWDSDEMPGRDAASIDPAYALKTTVNKALMTVLEQDYGWDDHDPLDIILEISYQLSSAEYDIVDIGQALAIDILRYLVAAQLLGNDDIDRATVDRALIAYLLPQVDVFMADLRKEETLRATSGNDQQTPTARYETFTEWVGELGLPQMEAELNAAADSYSVL